MNRLLVFAVMLGLSFSVVAQEKGNCEDNVPKKGQKKFDKILEGYSIRNSEAVAEVKELTDKFPEYVDLYYFLASHYEKVGLKTPSHKKLHSDLIQKSVDYYKMVTDICPGFAGHLAYFKLGVMYHKVLNDEPTAAKYFKLYLDNEKEPPAEYQQVASKLVDFFYKKDELIKNPVPFDPKLVKGVNSDYDEFLPMLAPDNEYLYLTRRMKFSPKKAGAITNEIEKEFFTKSRKMDVDSFTFGLPLTAPFNDFDGYLDGYVVAGLGGACLTPDNKRMYITVVLRDPADIYGVANAQLYYSDLVNGSWTPLKSIGGHINDENNEPTWEGQPTISSDGKLMIFATARPSSTEINFDDRVINSMDLFMVQLQDNGMWSAPKSLGPVINTKYNEKTPFLHTDSRTLYFASDGHPGMGGYDIFYTKMDDNGIWSEPVNLGYPINDEKDNHGLMVSLDGKFAFMSSGKEKDGKGGLQIINFPLYEGARPEKVVFMKGKLEDLDGNAVVNGKIQIKDEATGEIREALVDEKTGEYVAVLTIKDPKRQELPKAKIKLNFKGEEVEADFGSTVEEVNGEEKIIPPGAKVVTLKEEDYILNKGDQIKKVNGEETIVRKGYEVIDTEEGQEVVLREKTEAAAKQRFVLSATGDNMAFTSKVIEEDPDEIDGVKKVKANDIAIQKIKKGETIRLNDVNFATNSAFLNSTSMSVVDELARFLKAKPNLVIAIYGHTDNVGGSEVNLKLSKERAKEVMDYLIDQGIDASRLSFDGFGQTKPKASNKTVEGRAINRRVEFVIVKL